MNEDGPVLIIADGGLPGLLACAAAAPGSAVWLPPAGPGCDAALRQAEIYGLAVHGRGTDAPAGAATLVLLAAAARAGELRLGSVLWPIHAGPTFDLARASAEVDRASLVSRLASLDSPGVTIHAPYADLIDDQIADLALDMDLPIRTCWWYQGVDEGAGRERRRWVEALVRSGWRPPPECEPAVITRAQDSPAAAAPVR